MGGEGVVKGMRRERERSGPLSRPSPRVPRSLRPALGVTVIKHGSMPCDPEKVSYIIRPIVITLSTANQLS